MIKKFFCLARVFKDGPTIYLDPFFADSFEDAKKVVRHHLLTEAIGFVFDSDNFDSFVSYVKSLRLVDLYSSFDSASGLISGDDSLHAYHETIWENLIPDLLNLRDIYIDSFGGVSNE